jgi:Leucine-rich repeat (LRR) protein
MVIALINKECEQEASESTDTLDLSFRSINSLDGIDNRIGLKCIDLRGNRISDLQPLAGLRQLEALYLCQNQIENINPLASLTNLFYLTLGDNQIADLSPLAGLIRLRHIRLTSNRITDLSPLVLNPGFRGRENASRPYLILSDNMLTDWTIRRQVAILEKRNVVVVW